MPERRPGSRPPRSLYRKGLIAGWVASGTVLMLMALGFGYGFRAALLPVVLISAVFGPIVMVRVVSKLGPAQGSAEVRPTASLRLSGPYDDVFDRAVQAAGALAGSRRVRSNRSTGVIVTRVAPTWESFGEKVRLVVRGGVSGAEVQLSSKPRIPGTVIDQGKNERNLQAIVSHLSAN